MVVAILLSATAAVAQTSVNCTVKGAVVDSVSNEAIGYATVVLMESDTVVVTAVAADAGGRFMMTATKTGNYTLHVTAVGYSSLQRPVTVADSRTLDLGTLRMNQGVDIGNVVVAAQRPLVVADDEKIAYDVENDPASSSSQLVDIIRKVPQLSVDGEGNVLLNGQSDYKVMVNGRPSSSMSRNFKNVIESMPAAAIKKIEVITNPSTKYDSEGAGGIINIITNRDRLQGGYNGSVNSSYQNIGDYLMGSLYVAAQVGRFSFSTSVYSGGNLSWGDSGTSSGTQENFTDDRLRNIVTSGVNTYKSRFTGVNFESSFEFDTLNLLTVEFGYMPHNFKNRTESDALATDAAGDASMSYKQWMSTVYKSDSYNASVNYQHTFNKPEHTLTISYDMSTDNEVDDYNYRIYDTYNYDPTDRINYGNDKGFENTAQIDYLNPINEHHTVGGGLKYIYRDYRNNSSVSLFDEAANDYVDQPDYPRNDMDYTQHVLGLYVDYAIKFGKFSGRAGTRMEQTISDVKVKTEKENITYDPRFFNLVPYVSLNYRPDDSNTLSLSYTQRLSRPSLWQMNPYRDEKPLSVSYGNPDLDVTVSNNVALAWRKFTSALTLSLQVMGSFANNAVSQYSFYDDDVVNYTYGNIVSTRGCNFNASIGYRVGTKFNFMLSLQAGYTHYASEQLDKTNDIFTFGGNLNVNVSLWKSATLYAYGYMYRGGRGIDTDKSSFFYYTSFGLRQQFFKNKLSLSVNVGNPFSKYLKSTMSTLTSSYRSESTYRSLTRRIGFSVGYRFGKYNVRVKSTNRSISNDDMSSGGGNGGGGSQQQK